MADVTILIATFAFLLLACQTATAQPADEPSRLVFGDVGYARTWNDEGFLGSGAALIAGIGFRLATRLSIQAIVERIPYYRDIEYLTFDGRALFAIVEGALQSTRPKVRPFVTIGAGIMHDDRVWIRKTTIDPRLPRVHERSELHYNLAVMTASGGLELRVSERTSLRAGMRFHGLLDAGDDLAPHVILQPTIGAALKW